MKIKNMHTLNMNVDNELWNKFIDILYKQTQLRKGSRKDAVEESLRLYIEKYKHVLYSKEVVPELA